MSYEGKMLLDFKMPSRIEVEESLLKTLFKHNGIVKEFASGEEIVDEIANEFSLDSVQRGVQLQRIYRKENRIVNTPLWHRLLYRAADSLTKKKLVSNPTSTLEITQRKEWMLTEEGYDKVLQLLNVPPEQKEILSVKSFEVQIIANKLAQTPRPLDFNPFELDKSKKIISKEVSVRKRGFRQAVIEAYDFSCSFCGLNIQSPNSNIWEVEAAHIVPHSMNGKDELLNGLCLCRLHHWAFDVGWFSINEDYKIIISSKTANLRDNQGLINKKHFLSPFSNDSLINLPKNKEVFPHISAINWHRINIFHK